MNNEQFSLGIKISIIIAIIILIFIISFACSVLKTKSSTTSVLDEISEVDMTKQMEDDHEFKQYLEVGALLIQEEKATSDKVLETVITFLNKIILYETTTAEDGYICYDKEIVKHVSKELLGISTLEASEEIIFDENSNEYKYISDIKLKYGKCMNITKVEIKDNIYNVEYTCTFPTEDELYKLSEENPIKLSTYKIRAELQPNENYEYSKYYLKNIELLSTDIVQYN